MKAYKIEHPMQRNILRDLSKAAGLRFSQLKPDIVENSIFMYHVHLLVRQGLVKKHLSGQYTLTSEGLRHVALVTRGQLEHRVQPKLFSFLVLCNSYGEVALHTRAGQPFIGKYTFPGEVIYFNESIEDHMRRLLRDKVGIDTQLSLRGLVDTRLAHEGQVVSHVYAQILYGEVQGRPSIQSIDTHFTPEWVDLASVDSRQLLPDVAAIVDKAVHSKEYFFISLINDVL